MKRFIIIVLVIAVLLTLARHFGPRPPKEPGYREVRAELGDVTLTISTTGVVAPQNRVELKPPVPGRIESVRVSEGQTVTQGQVLALMSSTERACLLDAARARSEEEYERWKAYYSAVPILAPLAGTIISRDVEPGQTVAQGQTVLVLSDRLIVRADVDETDVGRIRVGMDAVISLDAYPDNLFTGKVDHVAYEARLVHNVTVYQVEVLPLRTPSFFKSGMTANVEFVSAVHENVVVLPVTAVTDTETGASVLMWAGTDPGRTRSKRVRTGLNDGKVVEIVEGLADGDIALERMIDLSKKGDKGFRIPFLPKPPQPGGGGGPGGGPGPPGN